MPIDEPDRITLATLGELDPLQFGAAGEARGREWIATLPGLISDLSSRWTLEPEGDRIWHGFHAVVAPVRRGERRLALKVVWPHEMARAEALALDVWAGHGAVELLESEPERGALLLERLDASRRLDGMPVLEAAAIAGRLVRTLAVEAPPSIPPLRSAAREIARGLRDARRRALPVPAEYLDEAAILADGLAESTAHLMVHADLHYANVLAGEREPWVAVDPKAFRGEPERSVPELLWTRVDELRDAATIRSVLDVVVEAADLNGKRAAVWGFVRTIDYWVWGLDNGLTEDPVRCRRVAEALAPTAVDTPGRLGPQ